MKIPSDIREKLIKTHFPEKNQMGIPDWYAERIKGDVLKYDSTSAMGRWYRHNFMLDCQVYPIFMVDQDLILEDPLLTPKFKEQARKWLNEFNNAYKEYKQNEKDSRQAAEHLNTFNTVKTRLCNDFGAVKKHEKELMASAIYAVAWESKKNVPRDYEPSFPYAVCLDYLIRLKADSIQQSKTGKAAVTILANFSSLNQRF